MGDTVKVVDLTPAEDRVLRLKGQGLTVREIAHLTGRAISTVRNHTHAAYVKLDVGDITGAYLAMGWLDIPCDSPASLLRGDEAGRE